jgi:hypothetical protein
MLSVGFCVIKTVGKHKIDLPFRLICLALLDFIFNEILTSCPVSHTIVPVHYFL